ncbi:MAG: extracellular solute-binding protein [Oscillospiraceae bacterium]|nr:extracellular solute-binding protein [Oscillospiraceae bacterium]
MSDIKKLLGMLLAFSLTLCLPTARAAEPEPVTPFPEQSKLPGAEAPELREVPISVADEEILISAEQTRIFNFSLDSGGAYALQIDYRPEKGGHNAPEIGVSFDSPYAPEQDGAFTLTRVYSYRYEDGQLSRDSYGNELIPDQTELDVWRTVSLRPSGAAGYTLGSGTRRLYITGLSGSATIRFIRITAVGQKTYGQYRSEHPFAKAPDYSHRQEAELSYQKSDLNISIAYDRSSPNISPNSATAIRYNLLAGSSFSKEGQWVSWRFDVPAEGWYSFDFYYRQNVIDGMTVYRTVKINDEIPFDELRTVAFPAAKNFTVKTPGDDSGEFAFYLERGECRLSLEVTLEPVEKAIASFKGVIADLNRLSNKINVIVGETVDPLRDYDLDQSVAGLTDTLQNSAGVLSVAAGILSNAGKSGGSYVAQVNETVRILNKMAENPKDISRDLSYFRSRLSTLSVILGALETSPLELDYLVLRATETPKEAANTYGIWPVLRFRLQSFFNSFVRDYQSLGDPSGGDARERLNIWVCGGGTGFTVGREHAQIVNELLLNSYSSKTGVYADLSLVDSGVLIQAIASGKGPDAALFTPKETVANLYYRGALVPMNGMESFESVKSRFAPSSLVAFETDGKLYALPEIQVFQMLFYRTDIFSEYGLTVPDTWQDFYRTVKRLQIEHLQTGIAESPQTFEMFLLQQGAELYNGERSHTLLTGQSAVEAFTRWTDLYKTYKLPVSFDMLNRFRSGQMPLIMAPVSFYSQLSVAAPEVRGLWTMAQIPATERSGELNRAQSSVTTGAVIIGSTGTRDYGARLDFADWWTSTETQNRFALASETRIGVSSRYYPANTETLETVFWTEKEREVLAGQWKSVWDIPQTPASYFVTRNLSNAFRRVVYNFESPRDVIYRYGQEIDGELTRKRGELGLD